MKHVNQEPTLFTSYTRGKQGDKRLSSKADRKKHKEMKRLRQQRNNVWQSI